MKRTEILTILMGAAMAFAGIYMLFRFGLINNEIPGRAASSVILVIGGAAAVFFRKNLKTATAVSMLTIGSSVIAGHVYYITSSDDIQNIVISMMLIIAGVVIAYYGLSLIIDASAGSLKGIAGLAILVVLEYGPTFYFWYMGDDLGTLIARYRDDLACGLMHLIVIIILTRKDMTLENIVRRINKNSVYLSDTMITPPGTYLDVRDVPGITGGPDDSWIRHEDGPIECEKSFRLYNADYCIRLQRWRGDGSVYLSVCLDNVPSYSVALMFPVECHVTEGDPVTRIRFYGRDGMFVDIMVKDPEAEKKGYIGTFKKKWKRFEEKRRISDPPASP